MQYNIIKVVRRVYIMFNINKDNIVYLLYLGSIVTQIIIIYIYITEVL